MFRTFGATVAMTFMAGAVWAADPVVGTWKTIPDDNGNFGHVQMAPCGDAFCGVLAKSFDSAGKPLNSPNNGKRIVWDMKAKGSGAYDGGKVWSPDRDKTYNSKMQLSGDRLTVQGCVLMICRDGGTWSRVR
ncbi:imidazoleglycerol-phosphate dehydratase [Oceanicola sp. 22II-s10i]|uniref:DUF2147 domain-containing protein n=1 Tax=Oceanicola sp. 22II-s10i TaxID=1317116 RepID=UPI000B7627F7|nr:DUF2147 domain-containing protein [Oceanicola sp. 22II-s10i]OWU84402.1 imidazoleglycerol-phosphate dehydratase [Oceanicola sp. 22II-s10i]